MIVKSTDSSHFYNQDGTPAYESTLREARKLHQVPSGTTVTKLLAKPGLERWKIEQGIIASLTDTPGEDESLDDYAKRAAGEAASVAGKAADFGNEMHDCAEQYIPTGDVNMFEKSNRAIDTWPYLMEWIDENIGDHIIVEGSAAHPEYGYGGRTDFIGKMKDGTTAIIDWKDQGTKEGNKINKYNEWCYQLAACDVLYPNIETDAWLNVVISSTEPGRIEVVRWSKDDIIRGFRIFHAMLELWRLIKKFPYERVDNG